MKNNIIDWLKTKRNYCYYGINDSLISYEEKFADMLFFSKVSIKDLCATECYIIEKSKDSIKIIPEIPSHHKYNFENFNVNRNEYVYNKVLMNEILKNYKAEDTLQNRVNIFRLCKELKDSYKRKNKFISSKNCLSFQELFYTKKENYMYLIEDIKESIINHNFDYINFELSYIDKIKSENRGLLEIGIYYPFVFNHNIFENKYYPFEINHLKFFKKNDNFKAIVKRFYMEFAINSNKSKDIYNLENYFTHPGFQYVKDFAYFNPIINYEKYSKEYKQIKEHLKVYNFDYKDFIFELFEFLNEVQIICVKFQQENLIDDFRTKRSRNRKYSFRELVDIQIKKYLNRDINDFESNLVYCILDSFRKQPANFIFNKNIKIENLSCYDNYPNDIKAQAQLTLDELLSVLNKSSTDNLSYIYEFYLKKLESIIRKYNFKIPQKKIFKNMLLDLILFYKRDKEEKLSKPYNSTLRKIYEKVQYMEFDNLIELNFQKEFINRYKYIFEQYIPGEIKDENGSIKQYYVWK